MINAEQFAKAGDKYIGRKYSDMDCQKFYEQCAKDTGLALDLAGSNAWYRKFIQTGWTERLKSASGRSEESRPELLCSFTPTTAEKKNAVIMTASGTPPTSAL